MKQEIEITYERRLCQVDDKFAWFHRWCDDGKVGLVEFYGRMAKIPYHQIKFYDEINDQLRAYEEARKEMKKYES